MLNQIELCGLAADAFPAAIAEVAAVYPCLAVVAKPRPSPGAILVDVRSWRPATFDPGPTDAVVAATLRRLGGVSLAIAGGDDDLGQTVLAVATRYQRLLTGRNAASAAPLFDRALGVHRALHDLNKPLVAADYDHALDVWRWVLRLAPEASLVVQLGALFHDIERLVSESEARVEQQARDYLAFKTAHARVGAEMTRTLLERIGAPPGLAAHVAALVAEHEQPDRDPDRLLLNEADALSFFSLNACGFVAYYGRAHTEKKIAYTLARLRRRGRQELARLYHRADLGALIAEATQRIKL